MSKLYVLIAVLSKAVSYLHGGLSVLCGRSPTRILYHSCIANKPSGCALRTRACSIPSEGRGLIYHGGSSPPYLVVLLI